MPPFSIHPQLRADCHPLGRFRRCRLLLHKNALLPWFILVPETEATSLFDLEEEGRREVLAECAAVARLLREALGFSRINFAAIGNLVPQLHLHLIGRREGDPCWPLPVWGHLRESSPYPLQRIEELKALLIEECGLRPEPEGNRP
ncbi:MAG: HIT family protein [Deltaproteobacteria bacterium]|nr:HIT family protein [Deltaproteobacteria bacterium]